MKIRFNSKNEIALGKTLDMHDAMIAIIFFLNIDNRYYPQIFLHEYLYNLAKQVLTTSFVII